MIEFLSWFLVVSLLLNVSLAVDLWNTRKKLDTVTCRIKAMIKDDEEY